MGDLAVFNPKTDLPDEFEYVDLESVVGTEMLSHRTESKRTAPSRAQRLAQTGDLFYQTVRPYQKNNYLFEKPDRNYVFSTGYAQMRPVTDGRFLLCLVQNECFVKVVLDNCTGTSYPAINSNDLAQIDVYAPRFPEEQRQIGNFFKYIDTLITLHQREESCAASFSASCFGTLKAFFWEQRKLSDLAEIVGGGTPDTNNSAYWDGDIDWYAPAEMEGQRYATGSVRKITELGLQKSSAKILPAHRTVLFTSRAGIGKMAILQRPAATNQGFQSLVLKDGTNPYFIYSMGEKIKDMAEGVASGSTFLEISGKMLGNLEVMVPNLKEQESIATFFRGIDDLITLHQCKPKSRKGGSHVLYSYQV